MLANLVQEEGAVTGHSSSVVHRCWDIAAKEVNTGLMNIVREMQKAFF